MSICGVTRSNSVGRRRIRFRPRHCDAAAVEHQFGALGNTAVDQADDAVAMGL